MCRPFLGHPGIWSDEVMWMRTRQGVVDNGSQTTASGIPGWEGSEVDSGNRTLQVPVATLKDGWRLKRYADRDLAVREREGKLHKTGQEEIKNNGGIRVIGVAG